MRAFVIGIAVGTSATVLWVLEAVRRNAERNRAKTKPGPRPDGGVRSYGEVWDHNAPFDPAVTA